jgi:hypothetical protein
VGKKKSKRQKSRWAWLWGGLALLAGAVIAPLVVTGLQPHVEAVSSQIGPQINVTVQDQSSCNFVAPLVPASTSANDIAGMRPADFNPPQCDDNIVSIGGAHNNVALEVVMEPTNDRAVVLTDVTIDVRDQTPTKGSAYYTPSGIGGGATTLTIGVDVEAPSPVQEITEYREDGSMSTFSSMKDILPRPKASESDPLVVLLSLYGESDYTSFDIVLHWQSGTHIGTSLLDNDGKGYRVAGTSELPTFNGFGDTWQAGP